METSKKQNRDSKQSPSSRETRREKRRQERRRKQLLNALIIVVGALAVVAVIAWGAIKPPRDIVEPEPREYPMANGSTMGDPDAPVVIKEYSDFQCVHCRDFALTTEKTIIDTYIATGYVHFEFIPFYPDANIPESRDAAEAALCAGDQNKFWEYHDIVFSNFSHSNTRGYSEKRLVAFAETIGLDMETFNACFDSHKYRDTVIGGGQEGRLAGVEGTPTFFINGEPFVGNIPFTDFQTAIEAAVAAAGTE